MELTFCKSLFCECVCVKQMYASKPEAYLVNVVRLQQHFPQETEEEWRRALHGKVGDDVILVSHGFPLPVLLFHVLLQVETRLLGDVVLFEESLREKNEEEPVVIKQWMEGSDLTESQCPSAPEVELESRTVCERPSYEV